MTSDNLSFLLLGKAWDLRLNLLETERSLLLDLPVRRCRFALTGLSPAEHRMAAQEILAAATGHGPLRSTDGARWEVLNHESTPSNDGYLISVRELVEPVIERIEFEGLTLAVEECEIDAWLGDQVRLSFKSVLDADQHQKIVRLEHGGRRFFPVTVEALAVTVETPMSMYHAFCTKVTSSGAHYRITLHGPDLDDVPEGDRAAVVRPTTYTHEQRAVLLEDGLAELDAMIGLSPVKRQVRTMVAQLRMTALRESHGLTGGAAPHHLVFAGPPGTGKTTVARIIGRVFAGLGLLERGHVVETQRGDLVGMYLGHTAAKTTARVDEALDGVLFVDEAYALSNTRGFAGDRDAFGDEALQVLLKRAEDDRNRLVIVLAGYPAEMERLLSTNPGLASRFNTRIDFPGYPSAELAEIADRILAAGGERLDASGHAELELCCELVAERGWADELGNGRFVRSLCQKARALRDLRIAEEWDDRDPGPGDLTTLTGDDMAEAFADLAGRFYPETPDRALLSGGRP